jgi:hypothetical protein
MIEKRTEYSRTFRCSDCGGEQKVGDLYHVRGVRQGVFKAITPLLHRTIVLLAEFM